MWGCKTYIAMTERESSNVKYSVSYMTGTVVVVVNVNCPHSFAQCISVNSQFVVRVLCVSICRWNVIKINVYNENSVPRTSAIRCQMYRLFFNIVVVFILLIIKREMKQTVRHINTNMYNNDTMRDWWVKR